MGLLPAHRYVELMARVIVFDGVCNLCNAWVRFVIRHDPHGHFTFAPFQGDAATELLRQRGVQWTAPASSVVLVESDRVYQESTAALRIALGLDGVWPVLARGLMIVPRPVRDAVYRCIARNRFRWFGRRDTCMVPTADVRSRFLSR